MKFRTSLQAFQHASSAWRSLAAGVSGYLILQICDFSWKIPLYRADPRGSAFTPGAFEPAETP